MLGLGVNKKTFSFNEENAMMHLMSTEKHGLVQYRPCIIAEERHSIFFLW